MQESSKWAREELRKGKEAKASRSEYLGQDGPRPLTPEEIEELRQEMKDALAKMKKALEKNLGLRRSRTYKNIS
ncbi:hypothetical protein [Vibrio fluvialis]|uniref:hypothetical protein n=1 Tax=Vibrio fluvialis TaxID=676 RepID=UPI0023A92297|nr:hypothetical protein [Vibrio fluvialis]MDE5178101.1 hypothetical protein [Vibrio fluvialis]